MKKLAGKVAIVTGGGQGVGLGMAHALAKAGASIVLTGRDAAKLEGAATALRAHGVEVLCVAGDARKRASANEAVAATIKKFGHLDILVNNAQSTKPFTMFENFNDDDLAMVVESGLYATVYFMQAAFPHMKGKGGSIINLGSREGIFGGYGMSTYAAAKEGIRGLSRSVAREWGQYKIRINVICPAALTPASEKFFKEHPDQEEYYRKQVALGYFGDSELDIGSVAVFLASEDARYLTGQTLNADGGQMML